MNVKPIVGSLNEVEGECVAVGIFEKQSEPPVSLNDSPIGSKIVEWIAANDLTGNLGEVTLLHGVKGPMGGSLNLFGLGPNGTFGECAAFSAGVALGQRISARQRGTVSVALPEAGEAASITSALVEGLIVGTRGPDLRKSEAKRFPFERLQVVIPPDRLVLSSALAAVERGRIVGEAVNLARELTNTPPSEKPPRLLAGRAATEAQESGLGVDVWDRVRIETERFGGVLGVSAGSEEPPAFVVLDYRNGGNASTLALVGKGVTFDSGGLSLKPSASMEDMKCDMTGSAVVLATMTAVARLKLPVNLRGYMVLTENMTGGRAMKLGDVLTIRNGKTVEVLNTDAEGRLILADALSYAVESQPDRILDLATLTGACMVALGSRIAGLFSNDDEFAEALIEASRRTGERVWRMPLDADFKDGLKSTVADMKNIGGKFGGAITAAKFLQEFVGKTPWVHLDIAGPSWADSEDATRDAGGTGCFVRTLIQLISRGFPETLDEFVGEVSIRCSRITSGWAARLSSASLREARTEVAFDPTAVDVERFENFEDLFHRHLVIDRPVEHVEIFLAGLEHPENVIDQVRILKFALQEAEVVVVELDPECPALQVFEPVRPEKSVPVVADPGAYGPFAEIPPGFLAFNPFESLGFFFTISMNTEPDAIPQRLDSGGATLAHGNLRVSVADLSLCQD